MELESSFCTVEETETVQGQKLREYMGSNKFILFQSNKLSD